LAHGTVRDHSQRHWVGARFCAHLLARAARKPRMSSGRLLMGQGSEETWLDTSIGSPLSWAGLTAMLVLFAVFDLCCLAPRPTDGKADSNSFTTRTAICHTVFWFFVGLAVNGGIWIAYGTDMAIVWFNGYILEYMLSMDNVFFFHVVFTSYATPPSQTYKALFLGIMGAAVLRLLFYLVGTEFFRLAYFVQIIFGLFIIYSAYKTVTSDEEDENPQDNRCVQCMTRHLPLADRYDDNGALFTRCTQASQPSAEVIGAQLEEGHDLSGTSTASGPGPIRGSMLFLVVLVLQVIDLVFAVDSVTAKIAAYDSVFLNFSSSAFSMLCLRSMYFVLAQLMKYFRFLKYGVGAILFFIGVNCVISHWVEIPNFVILSLLTGIFALSLVCSALFPEPTYETMEDDPIPGDAIEGELGQPGDCNLDDCDIDECILDLNGQGLVKT